MEFDILNELLTSTVNDLFSFNESTVMDNKQKVKELEGLIKNDSTRSRNSSADSSGPSNSLANLSMASEGSSRENSATRSAIRPCKSVDEWIKVEAPRRLKQSIQKLGINEELLKKKADLDAYVGAMNVEKLLSEKKKVKNELKNYDNDFIELFKNQPNHDEKQPFRPLYIYYKKLKEYITQRGGNEMSQQEIERKIKEIKIERKELRDKIQAYQEEFEVINNRRIRYARDIAPIDNEYKKYKELKIQILKLEEMLNR